MKAMWLSIPAIAALMMAGTASADLDLAKKSGCLSCHSIDKKIIGPSWKDVAAKYKDQADAKAALIESIAEGSKGKWGASLTESSLFANAIGYPIVRCDSNVIDRATQYID